MILDFFNSIWAIDRRYADQFMPTVQRMLSGQADMQGQELLKQQQMLEAPVYFSLNPASNFSSNRNEPQQGDVAVLSYKSAIVKYSQSCGPRGTEAFADDIRNAANDPRIVAIIIDMDSGGGAANAIANPRAAILEAREKKPVIGYAGNGLVASAAYGIMSACTEIFATYEDDQIGSIGTYCTLMDYEAALSSELQARVESIYASQSTAKNDFYEAWKKGDDTIIKARLDQFNQNFINSIKEVRGSIISEEVFDGRIVMANDAVSFGLIDGIKSFASVIERAFELSNNNTNNSNTKMKILVPNMDAAIDAINAGATVTTEALQAANDNLSPRGLKLSLVGEDATTQLTQELNAAKTAATDMQSRIDALTTELASMKTEREAIASSVGLTVAQNGDLIDQNSDPVELINAVDAVVDQRDAYGRKAGVITVDASQQIDNTEHEEKDPSIVYLDKNFPNK